MASTWSSLKFELIGTGEQSGTWGTTTNANLGDAIEQAIGGKADITMSSTSQTLTLTDTTNLQNARALYLNLSGAPGGAATLNVPAVEKAYIVNNGTNQQVTVKVTGQTGVAVPAGKVMALYDNGTDVVNTITHLTSLTLGSALPVTSGGTGATTSTGSGAVVLATSPTLVTPALGTPSSGTLTSCTGLPISTGVSGLGANVATFLATPSSANLAAAVTNETGSGALVFATSPTLVTPALGTPSSGTLTSCTGLPLSSGVTGQLPLANGGTGANLVDPNADRILFWDDSAGAVTFLSTGTGVSISGTTLSATGSGGTVTSVAASGGTGISVSGSPITSSGTLTISNTGVTSLSAGTGISVSGGTGAVTVTALNNGTVTSVSGTGSVQGLTLSGTVTSSGSLTLGGSLSAVNLTSQVTGTLPVGNGGTGASSLTDGYVLFGNSTSAIEASALLTQSAAVTSGTYVKAIGYADTVVTIGNTGTAANIDVVNGGVFTATLTGNCTFTLRYPVSSGSSSFTLILTNDGTAGRTVAWSGGTFRFPGGAASLSRTTTANAIDIWVFFTPNGGTTWYGNIAMKNMAA